MPVRSTPADSCLVDVDGGRLYVECRGDGPPLLMVHGWSLDRRSFDRQVKGLGGRFRVVVYDRRGFGRSDAPPDMRLELDDIDRILDLLAVESVHLLGVSQGGRIALRYALTRPARVRSLILQGPLIDGVAIRDSGPEHIPLEDYAALARDGRVDEIRRRWLEHPLMRLEHADAEGERLLRVVVGDYEARDLADYRPESYAFPVDPLDAVADFDKPLLVVTGARETEARKEHARLLRQHAPNCREVLFRRSGHLANVEESDRFNDTVTAFCLAADDARRAPSA